MPDGDAPLAGRGVLVTRPAGQGGELAAGLAKLGAQVHCIPAIELTPRPDDLAAAIEAAKTADWLVLTSAYAARLFLNAASSLPRIACIGPATAEVVKAAGHPVALLPAEGEYRAEGLLAALLKAARPGQTIVAPTALVTRDVLSTNLVAAGLNFRQFPIYQNSVSSSGADDLAGLFAAGSVNVVTFTSSSTVDAFHELAPSPPVGLLYAAIGPVTAETARARGYAPLLVAATATVQGLLETLAAHYQRGTSR